ncbi:4-hydroxybenzoate polyprenyltransferase [Saccharothrix coeruleofusca]|uniref:SCO3242 family prenyltransferase n=1 Tax=Saccharothrix coeruleofusca TaxID=33919 RepID=UPI0027DC71FB|nr:UbiA family prenyltransferase [Saccharothrix coeruleofusca]MBP2335087.1 4-hydroxybenzoate polyprenyltransferase [Saccharothrix coeruleofusca]
MNISGNPYLHLVRAPAALTVLGDTAAGAAGGLRGRRLLLPLSSVALYWSGMALNDWADRELDAVERPERPIPSGRISAGRALAVACGLSAAGLALAAAGGGRQALGTACALTAALWSYDTVLKDTPVGPVAMAACRGLDVLLGAPPGRRGAALPAAGALFAHTLGVTALSRGEVHGTTPAVARAVLAGTAATAVAAGAASRRGLVGAIGYAAFVGRAQLKAVRDNGARTVRSATAAGIHGMVPLQAALTARGSVRAALAVAAALPLARRFGRKVGPT